MRVVLDIRRLCFQKLNTLRKLDISIADKYLIDAVIGEITDVDSITITKKGPQNKNDFLEAILGTRKK